MPRLGLLAVATGFDQRVRDFVEIAAFGWDRVLLADAPADIHAGEVHHRERAHGHAPLFVGAVDVGRRRAFHQHRLHFFHVALDHAVADEAEADAGDDADLADLLRHRHGRCQHLFRGLARRARSQAAA